MLCYSLALFKKRLCCSYIVEAVNLCVPTGSIRDFSAFDVRHCSKDSPSANVFLRQILSADMSIFVIVSSFHQLILLNPLVTHLIM
jgi:hypothetical protein